METRSDDPVGERLAWHEAEERRYRELAASHLRQAEEHASKAAAFRLVKEDLAQALRQSSRPSQEPAPSVEPPTPVVRPAKKAFIDWVRDAVVTQADSFDLMSVRKSLDQLAPGLLEATPDRNALSKALSRLAETGEIYIVQKGLGKRPALYSKQKMYSMFEAEPNRPEEEVNDNNGQVSDRVPTSG